jgi:hypothetical protein
VVGGQPADVAVLGNLDLSRPLLAAARRLGIRVVVDLQDVQGWDNPYDQDFLAGADVLLMSHERLAVPPEDFLAGLLARTRAELIVLGMGAEGSLAWQRGAPAPVRTPGRGAAARDGDDRCRRLLVAGVVSGRCARTCRCLRGWSWRRCSSVRPSPAGPSGSRRPTG